MSLGYLAELFACYIQFGDDSYQVYTVHLDSTGSCTTQPAVFLYPFHAISRDPEVCVPVQLSCCLKDSDSFAQMIVCAATCTFADDLPPFLAVS